MGDGNKKLVVDESDDAVKVTVGGAKSVGSDKDSVAETRKQFDRNELRRVNADLDKELDRVESVDTESLAKQSQSHVAVSTNHDTTEEEMARPVDLSEKLSESTSKPSSDVVVSSPLQSHHLVQKQHQRRHISYMLVAVLTVLTLVLGGLVAYVYMQLADVNSQLDVVTADLDQTRAQREALLVQVGEMSQADESDQSQVRMIEDLGVQYTASDEATDIVYGYGGTTEDGVVYMHFTTRELADYRETVNDNEIAPCGIGLNAPVSVVRGTREQLEVLSQTQPVTEQKQLGEYYYALMSPRVSCSQRKSTDVETAKATIANLYATFETLGGVIEEAPSETSAP